MTSTVILSTNAILFAVVLIGASKSEGDICAEYSTRGGWTAMDDCQSNSRIDEIIAELKKRVEMEASAQRKDVAATLTTIDTGSIETTEPTSSTFVASSNSACNVSAFRFPTKNHYDYVRYDGTLPELSALTVCTWVKPGTLNEFVKGTIISYCTKSMKYCNTFTVWLLINQLEVFVNAKSYVFAVPSITIRSHLCIVWDKSTLNSYINGSLHTMTTDGGNSANIPGGGVLIFGQDQDNSIKGTTPGKQNQREDGFYAGMQGLSMWHRAFNGSEILDLYLSPCNCAKDIMIPFNESNLIIRGDVSVTYDAACD